MSNAVRRMLITVALLLLILADSSVAQPTGQWEIAEKTNRSFYQTSRRNKNAVIAADARHYLFMAYWVNHEIHVSDDTASTLTMVRSDAHPVLHYDMAYPTVDRIYVVADSVEHMGATGWQPVQGMIFRSLDRGTTWDTVTFPDGVQLTRIAMADALHGVAMQHYRDSSTYFATTDGWDTWQRLALPEGVGLITNTAMPERDVVIINGTVRTTDRGASWQRASAPPQYGMNHRMRFFDRNRGWSAGGVSNGVGDQSRDVIHKTTDGGMSWQLVLDSAIGTLPFGLNDIVFSDSLHGYAGGNAGKLLETTDGGVTWRQVALPEDLDFQYNLYYLDAADRGSVVGAGVGAIVRLMTPATATAPSTDAPAPRAYPNPARSSLVVEGAPHDARVSLVSIDGRVVAGPSPSSMDHDTARIDLTGIRPGVYVLRMTSCTRSHSQLVVVE